MAKPKKLEIGVWKIVEAKAVENIKKKSRSLLIESFRLNAKCKLMSIMLVGLKISTNQNLLQNRNSMNRIGNGAILTYQCRFHHMEHLYMCYGNFILISIILILHCLIIRIYHFLLDIFVQIILHIKESAIKKSPPANNDRFNHKNRSVQKKET